MVPDIFPPMNEVARHVKVAVLIATSGRFDLLEQLPFYHSLNMSDGYGHQPDLAPVLHQHG